MSFGLIAFLIALPVQCDTAPQGLSSPHWLLTWDDTVDGCLDEQSKACTVTLKALQGRVAGNFLGPVLGETREALFQGDLIAGTVRMLTLVQVESDYVCSYQMQEARPGVFSGVWHDNRGRRGDVLLNARVVGGERETR